MAVLITSLVEEIGVKGVIFNPSTEEVVFGAFITKNKGDRINLIKSFQQEDRRFLFTNPEVKDKFMLKVNSLVVHSIEKLPNIGRNAELIIASSTKLDSRTASLKEMLFLIKKEENEGKELLKIKELFFNNYLKNLPIPILKEWEDFLWEEIFNKVEELPEIGSLPFRGYKLSIEERELLDILPKIASKAEFKKRFGRIPKMEALLNLYDINNFNFKDWQKVLQKVDIESTFILRYLREFVLLFELLGTELVEEYATIGMLSIAHASSVHYANIKLRKLKSKNEKQEFKSLFKNAFLHFKNKDSYLLNKVMSAFADIYENKKELLKNKSWNKVAEEALYTVFKGEYDTYKEFALEAMKNGVSEKSFENKYMPLIEAYVEEGRYSYREFPTIKKNNWEIIDWTVPKSWFVGIETNCCQHLDSAGAACIRYGVKNIPTSGIFRVMDERGNTIAQSFLWLSEDDKEGNRVLVCDSIEFLGGKMRDSMIKAYKEMAEELKKYAKLFRIKAITVGAGFSPQAIKDLGLKEKLDKNSKYYGEIPKSLGYTDAKKQYLLKKYL